MVMMSGVLLICGLLSTFIIECNAKFQRLLTIRNKFLPFQLTDPSIYLNLSTNETLTFNIEVYVE